MTVSDPVNGESIKDIAKWLSRASSTVVFTGAGMSTESGIPDFRSPGGIWANSQPVLYDDFLRDRNARYEYWRQKSVSHSDFVNCPPNQGHQILAEWERQRRIKGVITQNIDGLHSEAGNENVIEIHGTARKVGCLDCSYLADADPYVDEFLQNDRVPVCPECAGRLKHATISFGQSLDEAKLNRCQQWIEACELMLVLGSSLVVEPAASIPRIAKRCGARVVIVNRDPTPLDGLAEITIAGEIGPTLMAIQAELVHKGDVPP